MFPHQNPVYTSPLPHMHYMPCPSHSSWFYHPHNIGWGVQIIQLQNITKQFKSLMPVIIIFCLHEKDNHLLMWWSIGLNCLLLMTE
jgi:hypothetical protein